MAVLSLHYSRTHHQNDPSLIFIASTLVVTMECFKLVMNLAFLLTVHTNGWSPTAMVDLLYSEVWCQPANTFQMTVPISLLYIVQDNLIIFDLTCLDAATFQVTYQMRILTTAMFSKFILKKELTTPHWLALVLLLAGVALAQVYIILLTFFILIFFQMLHIISDQCGRRKET